MRRAVKVILFILVIAAIGGGVYYNMSQPLRVAAMAVSPRTAELTFTERGVVDYENRVNVYSPVTGKIVEATAVLGQAVKAGDALCKIDSSDIALAVSKSEAQITSLEAQISGQKSGISGQKSQIVNYEAQIGGLQSQIANFQTQIASFQAQIANFQSQIVNLRAQISGFEAQKRNLDSETAKQRDTLISQKNNLEKQLDSLAAQQNSAGVSKEDQANMQNIILAQNQADIERLTTDYNNMQILYDNGVVPETDLKASQAALDAANAQYEQNLQRLQIIQNGDAQSSDAYFEASRGAIQVQIDGIDAALSKDYSGAMKDYYDAQIQGVEAQIEGVNSQIDGANSQIDGVNAQIDGVGEQIKGVNAQIEAVNAQIEGLNAQVDSLNSQIGAVNADIQAQEKLREDSTIVSTADGIVADLPVSTSNMAYAASLVAVIATGRSLVIAHVSTNDIDNVSVGKEVALILRRRDGDETYKGRVVKIDDKAESQVSSLGVEERKVKVYVQPEERPELFLTGYDADVKFTVYQKKNALVLPKTAVFKDGDVSRVWVIKGGALQKAEVKKGMELTNDVVIEGGLAPGDNVVTDSAQKELKEGALAVAE